MCTLSDEELPGGKFKRREKYLVSSKGHGDGKEVVHEILAADPVDDVGKVYESTCFSYRSVMIFYACRYKY